MPRFYFHIREHLGLIRDEIGLELPDAETAKAGARQNAGVLATELRAGHISLAGRFLELVDEDGNVLMLVPLAQAC